MAASTSRADRAFPVLAAALIGLAWLALWLWGRSAYAWLLSHEGLEHVGPASGPILLGFVAGWVLMVVAMMLPTSLPLVTLFRAMVRRRPERAWLVLLLVAGYLSIWTLFGILAHLGDWGLHQAVDHSPLLQSAAPLIGAGVLLLAGLYQFTPLKHRCLDRCRSPLSFIAGHWSGRRVLRQAFGLGVHHGLFCLGCCWALMLLMFAVGAGNLIWMLLLGAVMAIEKNIPWGRRLSAPLGVFLIAWAGVMIVSGAGALL